MLMSNRAKSLYEYVLLKAKESDSSLKDRCIKYLESSLGKELITILANQFSNPAGAGTFVIGVDLLGGSFIQLNCVKSIPCAKEDFFKVIGVYFKESSELSKSPLDGSEYVYIFSLPQRVLFGLYGV